MSKYYVSISCNIATIKSKIEPKLFFGVFSTAYEYIQLKYDCFN